MQAIILAGGEGTRLRPLTVNTPKPLVPVVNKPLLIRLLEMFKLQGIDNIILSAGYLSEKIEKALGDGSNLGLKIGYAIEDEPLDTGGAIKNSEGLLRERFVVIGGDDLPDIDFYDMERFHVEKKALITMALIEREDVSDYGLVDTDEEDRIISFREKPDKSYKGSGMINTLIWMMEPEVLSLIPAGRYSAERQLFPYVLEENLPLFGYKGTKSWLDLGTISSYLQSHRDIISGSVKADIIEDLVEEGIWIGEKVDISSQAELINPVVIGAECRIEAGARIGPYAILGSRVEVSGQAEVKNSVIWSGSLIGKGLRLDSCVIGYECRVEDYVSISGPLALGDGSIIARYSRI